MKILVVAPHADDETLGVGGTMARLAAEGHDVTVAVMTGHGDLREHPLGPRSIWERVRSEGTEAWHHLGVKNFLFREIPAVMVAEQPLHELNKLTHELIESVRPEVLFVPFLHDLHRDHREVFHSFSVAWRTCTEMGRRIREIYAYETISETHLNFPYVEQGFLPNVWVDISDYLERKLTALRCFQSQMKPFPACRSVEACEALARWRGSQIDVAAAEAFVLVRMIRGPQTPPEPRA